MTGGEGVAGGQGGRGGDRRRSADTGASLCAGRVERERGERVPAARCAADVPSRPTRPVFCAPSPRAARGRGGVHPPNPHAAAPTLTRVSMLPHAGTGQDFKRVKLEGPQGLGDANNGVAEQARLAQLEAEVDALRYRAGRCEEARAGGGGGGRSRSLRPSTRHCRRGGWRGARRVLCS